MTIDKDMTAQKIASLLEKQYDIRHNTMNKTIPVYLRIRLLNGSAVISVEQNTPHLTISITDPEYVHMARNHVHSALQVLGYLVRG